MVTKIVLYIKLVAKLLSTSVETVDTVVTTVGDTSVATIEDTDISIDDIDTLLIYW